MVAVPISTVGGTSVGYGGTVDEQAWARLAPHLGAQYGVLGPTDWRVAVVSAADRTVSIAAGTGYGYGVFDTTPGPATLQLGTVASGSRWDVIVARRNWSGAGGTTEFDAIPATTLGDLPATRANDPGELDEQPIALVQVTAGQTVPTAVIDLRVWQANGGAVALSEKVLQYLAEPGTTVQIGVTTWQRTVSSNGVASWRVIGEDTGWLGLTAIAPQWNNPAGALAMRARRIGNRVQLRGVQRINANVNGGVIPGGSHAIGSVPTGMAPSAGYYGFVPCWINGGTGPSPVAEVTITSSGALSVVVPGVTTGLRMHSVTYLTD